MINNGRLAGGCAGAGNGVLNPSQTTLPTTLAAAPTGGTALLSLSPTAAFGVAAGVALAAALSMLRLGHRLPEAGRLTPRPRR
jgi:hypothetical protein